VNKPQQYIGCEFGQKERAATNPDNFRFLLCFPDTYEIGMSNFALKILYEILDEIEGVEVDRAFVPEDDFAALLKKTGYPFSSLERRVPVSDFDTVGFTLEYELNFSNVLYFLGLAGIPLRSSERNESHPIIIAGGSACVNPEPMADFIDVFFIGDGEPVLPEIASALKNAKEKGASRGEKIAALSGIRGAYVPAYYEAVFDDAGRQSGLVKKSGGSGVHVAVRTAVSLEDCPHPVRLLVPNFETVFNRGIVEIARGCKNACRFCQAGYIYRPYRERSLEAVKDLIDRIVRNTGYSEFTLSSLSATDYSKLKELIDYVLNLNKNDEFSDTLFSVSLPSQRISTFSVELARSLSQNRKSGLTFAPEAGSQRMRDIINKNVTENDLRNTVAAAIDSGYRLIKLYFMIGLPFETDEDIRAMARLISEVSTIAREKRARGFAVNVTVSTFVPKPHTPFQWCKMASVEEVRARQKTLKEEIKRHREVTLKFTSSLVSTLESAIARGGRELCRVFPAAVSLGCRFDAWDDRFNFESWKKAFSSAGIDIFSYAARQIDTEEFLPWEIIDTGVKKEFLAAELEAARTEKTTSVCVPSACRRCGACR